jgi:hypothetical protein
MANISYAYDSSRTDIGNKFKKVFNGVNVLPFGGGAGQIWLDYKGPLRFEGLYKRMFEKLKQMGYVDTQAGDENIEDWYYENRTPDGTKGEILCWWRAHRTPDNNMFKYRVHILFQCLGMKEETVVINGRKEKINKGDVNMFFIPFIESKGKDVSLGSERVTKWWFNSIYKHHEEAAKIELFAEIQEIYSTAKVFLGMESAVRINSDFHEDWNVPKGE